MMRMVLPNPLTLALMRVVCFEASIIHTSFAGMLLALAIARMGSVTLGSSRRVTLLNVGTMNTGTIMIANTKSTMLTTAPQIHHVRGSFLTTQNSTTMATPPSSTLSPSALIWSHIHGPNVCVASPYFHSRK